MTALLTNEYRPFSLAVIGFAGGAACGCGFSCPRTAPEIAINTANPKHSLFFTRHLSAHSIHSSVFGARGSSTACNAAHYASAKSKVEKPTRALTPVLLTVRIEERVHELGVCEVTYCLLTSWIKTRSDGVLPRTSARRFPSGD